MSVRQDMRQGRLSVKAAVLAAIAGLGLGGGHAYAQSPAEALAQYNQRAEWEDKFDATLESLDAIKTSTPILNLPATEAMKKSGRGSWKKSPSLAEAHRHFFGEDFDGAHSAKADAWACARIYFHLTQKHDIGRAP